MYDPQPNEPVWHVTDDPDFRVKPGHKPWVMRGLSPHQTEKPGLFVTDNPHFWNRYFSKGPLYAARIDTSRLKWGADWHGFIEPHEYIIEAPEKVRVVEFLRLEEAIRKYPGQFGHLVEWSSVLRVDPKTDKEYAIPRRGLTQLRQEWLKERPGWFDPEDWYAAPRDIREQPLLDGKVRALKEREVKYDEEYDEVVLGDVTTLDGDPHRWDTKGDFVILREGVLSEGLAHSILAYFKEDYGRNPLVPMRLKASANRVAVCWLDSQH